jgi:hypothetical protein
MVVGRVADEMSGVGPIGREVSLEEVHPALAQQIETVRLYAVWVSPIDKIGEDLRVEVLDPPVLLCEGPGCLPEEVHQVLAMTWRVLRSVLRPAIPRTVYAVVLELVEKGRLTLPEGVHCHVVLRNEEVGVIGYVVHPTGVVILPNTGLRRLCLVIVVELPDQPTAVQVQEGGIDLARGLVDDDVTVAYLLGDGACEQRVGRGVLIGDLGEGTEYDLKPVDFEDSY